MSRTREQDREYQRKRRLRIAAEQHEAAVDAAPAGESTLARVRAELDSLPAAATMQAAVAGALAMARVLDDPAAVPQHPAAAGQLRQIMAEIRSARVVSGDDTLSRLRASRGRGRVM